MYFFIKNNNNKFNNLGLVRFIDVSNTNLYYLVEDAYDKDIIEWFYYEDLIPTLYERDKLSNAIESQLVGNELMNLIDW